MGDYNLAGELVRGLLAEGLSEPEFRGRALTVLGTVLFYNNRAPMYPHISSRSNEPAEVRDARKQARELAERALRDAIALGGASAQDARIVLAEFLVSTARRQQAAEVIADYDEAVDTDGGDDPQDPRLVLARRCIDLHRRHDAGDIELRLPTEGSDPRVSLENPQYTPAARSAQIQGTVRLQLLIDDMGRVACAWPQSGLPHGLTEAALAVAADWRFEKLRKDGRPIAYYYLTTIDFRLS